VLRLSALVLLLVNLLLLSLHLGLLQGLVGARTGSGLQEPERLLRQVNPGAVRLLPATAGASAADAASSASASPRASPAAPAIQAASAASAAASSPRVATTQPAAVAAAAAASATAAKATAANSASAAMAAPPATPPSAAAATAACLEAGPFDSSALATAERGLQQAGLPAGRWQARGATTATAYLVYMGPYPEAGALVRKRDELRQLAVAAYPVDADSGLQPGLSLGRHASAAAAETAMAALGRRGVRTARVVAVPGSASAGSLLRVTGADPALQARLAGLALPGGQGFRACVDAPTAAAALPASGASSR
jgi:hypothetical protein